MVFAVMIIIVIIILGLEKKRRYIEFIIDIVHAKVDRNVNIVFSITYQYLHLVKN